MGQETGGRVSRQPGRLQGARGARRIVALALAVLGAGVGTISQEDSRAQAATARNCAPGSDWGSARPDLAKQIHVLVNQHRAKLRLARLSSRPALRNAAVWKALHMARYEYLSHDDPAPPFGRSVGARLAACGYTGAGLGENIASGNVSAQEVMDAWLGSPGHRRNIEDARHRSLGVGVASSSAGTLYWVQDFGTYRAPKRARTSVARSAR